MRRDREGNRYIEGIEIIIESSRTLLGALGLGRQAGGGRRRTGGGGRLSDGQADESGQGDDVELHCDGMEVNLKRQR